MSLGSPSVPSSPTAPIGSFIDPFALANVQQTYNVGAGVANQAGSMPAFNTPTYSQNVVQMGTGPGGVPLYGLSQNLSPQEQSQLGWYQTLQEQATQNEQNLWNEGWATMQNQPAHLLNQYSLEQNTPAATSNIQNANTLTGQYSGQNPNQIGDMAQGLTAQRMAAGVSAIQPFQQTQRQQLDTQLKNQGLQPGEPGYDNAMRQMDMTQNLAVSQMASQFEPQAFQQATQIFTTPEQQAQAQQQQSQATNAQTNQNIGLAQAYGNLYGSMMSQSLPWLAASAPTLPQTPQYPGLNIQPTNVAGLGSAYNTNLNQNYANQLAQYQAQLGQNQNMLSGLFGIGSSVLGGLAAGGLFA